jgi:hypothetical protein
MLVLLIIMMLIAPMLGQVAVQMPEAGPRAEKAELPLLEPGRQRRIVASTAWSRRACRGLEQLRTENADRHRHRVGTGRAASASLAV